MQPTTPTDFGEYSNLPRPDESRYAHDAKLYVEFYRSPFLLAGKSRDAGRAIYEERDCVRIHVPGDKNSVIDRPVTEQDVQRFQDRYTKWKSGQDQSVIGTPLSALPGMTPAKVEEYKYFKLTTVEQMAEANDSLGTKFMSFHQDKQRAKNFLEVAAGNAPIEKMTQELAVRDEQIETLKQQVASLVTESKKRKVAVAEEA
ncbi:hypothetical protein UFOVP601_14 [uncultured Caudovirales phage]|uniref:Uncharacterized protein n=1 Tax=uncultured Caudovirales phage TaxID=2100421 RepID=A0A6J5N2C7_9CAUD|nr:hypothetical protein UFOVP601_14 [uncultured Caudovirales phage]